MDLFFQCKDVFHAIIEYFLYCDYNGTYSKLRNDSIYIYLVFPDNIVVLVYSFSRTNTL